VTVNQLWPHRPRLLFECEIFTLDYAQACFRVSIGTIFDVGGSLGACRSFSQSAARADGQLTPVAAAIRNSITYITRCVNVIALMPCLPKFCLGGLIRLVPWLYSFNPMAWRARSGYIGLSSRHVPRVSPAVLQPDIHTRFFASAC
jgi:hypothetical protein